MNGRIYIFLLMIWGEIVYGEIETVEVKWNAIKCMNICTPLIERNLIDIGTISNLQINERSGVAVMGWDPNQPFSFEPFRYAFSASGIRISDIRLRVRGTIAHDSDNFYLVSIGDGTRFTLVGPLYPERGRYIPLNVASHPLLPKVKDQLLEAENNRFTVVISGPLYSPNYPPNILVAEEIKINEKATQMDSRFQR